MGIAMDVSRSLVKNDESEDDANASIDLQSMASSNFPSFDGSKMFAKRQGPGQARADQPMNKENMVRG